MFEFVNNSQSVEKLRELQLNYNALKQISKPIKCERYDECSIISHDKISEALRTYFIKLQCTVVEKNKLTFIRNPKNEDKYDSSKSNNADQTLQICTIDPSSENLSDNALLDLFTCEVQNSKKDSKFLRETLTDLSIAYDARTNWGSSFYDHNVQNVQAGEAEYNTTLEQNISENSRHEKLDTPENNTNLTIIIKEENLRSQQQIAEKSTDESKSGNTIREETICNMKINNQKKTSNSHRNTRIKKSPSSSSPTDRPYNCSKCKMAFKRNLHLKRHFLVTHTMNKNFVCDICGKSFSRKDYLDKHTVGHQKKSFKLKLLKQGIVVRTKIYSKSNMEKSK